MISLHSSARTSAPGLPASPSGTPRRTVLILNGRFAQHVASVTKLHRGGGIDAVVQYGHVPGCSGQPISLTGVDYVSTESKTCPALPKQPSFAQANAQ